jgi:hypothetical protein
MTTIAVTVAADTTISATVTETVVAVNVVGPPTFNVNIESGVPGPQGPPGPAGGSAVTFPAGEEIAPARVVIVEGGAVYHFQPSNVAHQGRAYGISTASASTGATATVQIGGQMEHASFTFAADKMLYVFNNGIIVDTDPDLAIAQLAGVSSGPNKMRIDFSISIKKA